MGCLLWFSLHNFDANIVQTMNSHVLPLQELLYVSLKFVNNVWVLGELKIATGQSTLSVSIYTPHFKCMLFYVTVYLSLSLSYTACLEDLHYGRCWYGARGSW